MLDATGEDQLALFGQDGKRCPRCRQVLPLEMFKGWSPGRAGQFVYCMPCRSAYSRDYKRSATPEQQARTKEREAMRTVYGRVPPNMNRHIIGRYRRAVTADPCAYCGELPQPCKWTGRPNATVDHITPRSQEGELSWTNETASCWSCNRFKSYKPLLHFLLEIADRRR